MARYINADLILEKTQKELDVLMRIYNRHKNVLNDKMLTRLDGVIHGLESVRYRIKNAPAADVREVMSSAWIPCEEWLPTFGWFLTTSDTGYNTTHVGMTLYNGKEWEIEYKVKAWMPLPEPFKP